MRTVAIAVAFSIALMLNACSGGGSSSGPPPPPPPPPPSALSYPAAPAFAVATAITPLTPAVTGSVTSYSVSPALPTGLTLNGTTGVISGTPTVITAKTTYTVTASNPSGSTVTTIMLVVNDVAPVAGYDAPAYSYTAGVASRAIIPMVSAQGGGVVSWSVNPSLPAGLDLNTTDGTISGTPNQAAPVASYTVTATNSGGAISLPLLIAVAAAPLLDLGHNSGVIFMRHTGTRVLSVDFDGHWVLQNFASGSFVLTGEQQGGNSIPSCSVDVEGPTLMAPTPTGINTFNGTTGAAMASVTVAAAWCALASDGSYVATGTASGLTVWSPTTGQMLFTRAGNYVSAAVHAQPGRLEVANGPAGANVIEMLSVPGGGSTMTSAFNGQFSAWFIDGTSFLTTQGTTVRVYSSASVQQNILTVSGIISLGGEGQWFWTCATPGVVNVYAVGTGGSPPPAYSYLLGSGTVIGSGTTLGLLPTDTAEVTVVDLSGAIPVGTTYPTSIAYSTYYAASPAGSWVVGNWYGVVVDGSQLPAKSRFLTYGEAFSIVGGANQFAIATASGHILYFDSATKTQLGDIPFPSSNLSMSTDGSVLAAATSTKDSVNLPSTDRSIRIYSLPSGTVTNTIPYTLNVTPFPDSMTMSGSGTVIAETLWDPTTCHSQLIPTSGGSPIWCDPNGQFGALRLSPDGTLLSVVDSTNTPPLFATTNTYKDGALVATITGAAPGWIDNDHLLVNNYVCSTGMGCFPKYVSASIYDGGGTQLATIPAPEMSILQPVTTTSVYSPELNEIVSTVDGTVMWRSGDSLHGFYNVGGGAVAGSLVIFASGSQVLVQSH